jgi:hypothetical protein
LLGDILRAVVELLNYFIAKPQAAKRSTAIAAGFLDFGFDLFDLFILYLDVFLFAADVDAQAGIEVQINVGDENQGEPGDDVATPIVDEQFELREQQEKERDPVAEAIFAGEEIEKFAFPEGVAALAFVFAPVAGFTKNFLEDDGASDGGDGDGEDEEPENLLADREHETVIERRGRGHSAGIG